MSIPRPEYPRPQFVREHWLNLNGVWRFDFDDHDIGLRQKWHESPPLRQQIRVPFAFQAPASGIGSNDFHDVVWYQRDFDLPAAWANRRILLHFGAVDYRAWVWINGQFVTFHEGGHTPFTAEITPFVLQTNNSLVIRVEDLSQDRHQPRGKQYWERESASIFYTRTTGIWQTVWLEAVADVYLAGLRLTPDIDHGSIGIEYVLAGRLLEAVDIETEISFTGIPLLNHTLTTQAETAHAGHTFALNAGGPLHLWSPESPALYDLTVRLKRGGRLLDEVRSYFGMRKISIEGGQVRLNNQPYFMRLVLDQGYHPQGVLTFPADDDYKRDIELTRAMGFNGARKHQKIEDPRYLYWADRLGLLVWGEMANSYDYSPASVQRITAEWQAAVRRDYNHPCIVAWVPVNESWGVPDLMGDARQRDHLLALYHLTRSLDTTRLVVSNDGWEHAQSDLLTIHDYEGSGPVLRERYGDLEHILSARPARRDLFVPGMAYGGAPVLLSEFGGIAFRTTGQEGWGYTTAGDETAFVTQYRAIMEAVLASTVLQGYCYTQLTDVEQEINGLLTYERQPKTDLATIARINGGTR